MKKRALLFSIFFIFFGIHTALAEVPGHNPDLDHKCSEGFQWSRSTVACEQANCPPGASRTYTLECNCGEAWNKPFRTCYSEIGLASHCISKDQNCEDVPGGFDPVTGECKFMEGYEWNDDNSKCVRLFPNELECKLVDILGNPVSNLDLTAYEYGTSTEKYDSNQTLQTDSNGVVKFPVANTGASSIKIMFRGNNDYNRVSVDIDPNQGFDCTLEVYDEASVEQFIKDEYTDLLKDACLTQEQIDKIMEAKFIFDADVDTSQYDSLDKVMKISSGDMGSGWEDLKKAIMHEFAHYISDSIIDPTSIYVKGVPMFGKHVGGKHNNWEVHPTTDNWGPDIDPEQNAFEEALADFIASMYFASQGEVYQDDINTPDFALDVINQEGRENATKIEGAIAAFLNEYYKDQVASGDKGAAHALGDFIRAATYDSRTGYTWMSVPARTIQEWLASKTKSDKNDTPNDCTPAAGQTPNLSDLANKYGFDGSKKPKVQIQPISRDDIELIDTEISSQNFGNTDGMSYWNLTPIQDEVYEIPANTGVPTIQFFPTDYVETGVVHEVSFSPDTKSVFSVDTNNTVHIQEGNAHVLDTAVATPNLNIVNNGTEYLVSVLDGNETITVMEGQVTATETEGEGRVFTVFEGDSVAFDAESGFGEPTEAEEEIEKFTHSFPDKPESSEGESFLKKLEPFYIHFFWAGFILVLFVIAMMVFGKKAK